MKVTFAQRKLFVLVRHFSLAVFLPLAAFLSLLLAPSPAAAVTVPLIFDGPENTFDASLDLSGNLFADGNGIVVNNQLKLEPYKFKAPLNHSLSLSDFVINSTPHPTDTGATVDSLPSGQITNLNDISLDLLNGQTVDFAIDTVFQTSNSTFALLKNISFDFAATITSLAFTQTSAASIGGVGSNGTFLIPGTLSGGLSNFQNEILGFFDFPGEPASQLSVPFTLSGTWSTSGAPGSTKLTLDGALDSALPLSLHAKLSTIINDVISITYNSTIDLMASLLISGSYHLETTIVIPEPGTIALLVVGLAALVPLARRRFGRPSTGSALRE